MSTAPSVPPGQYPPFATVTDTDHRAWIIIATALGSTMTMLASAIRVFLRYSTSSDWGFDDASLAVATILSFVQSALVLAATADGLGKSIGFVPLELQGRIESLYYASNLFFIVALAFSKCSIILFLRRLTPAKNQRRYVLFLVCLLAAWTVGAFIAIALECGVVESGSTIGRRCPGRFMRWEVVEILASLFELAIFAFALWLVWELQTKVETKSIVVVLFSFRLIVIIVAGIRLGSFRTTYITVDPTLHEAAFICWTQTELNYSIIAATIPTARQFVLGLNTHFGRGNITSSNNSYGYGYGSHTYRHHTGSEMPNSIQMGSLQSNGKRKHGQRANRLSHLGTAPDHGVYSYDIEGPTHATAANNVVVGGRAKDSGAKSADATSVSSESSQRMIIRKDTTFQIRHDQDEG